MSLLRWTKPHLLIGLAAISLGLACAGGPTPIKQPLPTGQGPIPSPVDPGSKADLPPPSSSEPSRTQAAMEGAMMGALIGGQAGPIGAAIGAGALMIYGAITGDVPMQPAGRASRGPAVTEEQREQDLEKQLEDEMQRQASLEEQIQEELRRQEDMLRQIDRQESQPSSSSTIGVTAPKITTPTDPREAPVLLPERDPPMAIFDEKKRVASKGTWNNDREIQALERSLDADRDGSPEEIRYHDQRTGLIFRKENDRNFDGEMDAWTDYKDGTIRNISLDNIGNGNADEWQKFDTQGKMINRDVDRDGDGIRDVFYLFEDGSLVQERHDSDDDGKIDRVVYYEARRMVRAEEDSNQDGAMDTWTEYSKSDGNEFTKRIEKDTDGDGKRDTFESYEIVGGVAQIATREEDRNADGIIDIKSFYSEGKLRQREIVDPSLVPL